MNKTPEIDRDELRAKLWGSLLLFTKTFYKILTGRDFIISNPMGREAHQIIICRELSKTLRLETQNLMINICPGSGKSTLVSMFVAWGLSRYPDSRFLYISYGKELATRHTETIKNIITLPEYKYIFDVHLRTDSKAKDYFRTTQGGAIQSFGSSSAVTGMDAGLPGLDRFSGALILDDLIKPDEAHSDTIRNSINRNYIETIMPRPRGINVPTICIGQRIHEEDPCAFLLSGQDGKKWDTVILKSLDDAGNAMYPEIHPKEMLETLKVKQEYFFYSQHQQQPLPPGGSLFKREFFHLLDEEPELIATFITADTAESNIQYNDATAFSFWGLYTIKQMGVDTGTHALHWINGVEIRVEPKDLRDEFMLFYHECLTHKTPPLIAYIEKKSTGVTLLSVLAELRGLRVVPIERTKKSGCKTQRFLDIQPYLASNLVSLTKHASHTEHCITHMIKITANETHAHDDLADTCADAIKLALIDKLINYQRNAGAKEERIMQNMTRAFNQVDRLRRQSYEQQRIK